MPCNQALRIGVPICIYIYTHAIVPIASTESLVYVISFESIVSIVTS